MVVVGLSQTEDIDAVRAALAQAGLSPDDLETVGPDDETQDLTRDRVPSGIITSDRGMSVPGIDSDESYTLLADETVVDRLGDLGIPEKDFDNYVEAIERGKTVVACIVKTDNADKIAAAFTAANLTNVRQF